MLGGPNFGPSTIWLMSISFSATHFKQHSKSRKMYLLFGVWSVVCGQTETSSFINLLDVSHNQCHTLHSTLKISKDVPTIWIVDWGVWTALINRKILQLIGDMISQTMDDNHRWDFYNAVASAHNELAWCLPWITCLWLNYYSCLQAQQTVAIFGSSKGNVSYLLSKRISSLLLWGCSPYELLS